MTREKSTASQDRDQILAEHREIAELTAKITDSQDREPIADGLFRLESLLARHFQREESQDGLHESVELHAPRHTGSLEQLEKEHREILARLARLRTSFESSSLDEIRAECANLFEEMRAHEARETEVFLDSVWSDLGTGD